MNDDNISEIKNTVLKTINLKRFGKKYSGKVRDFYIVGDTRILITTDRQSAFDVNLGFIPYKGAVLNLLSKFWFEQTKHIVKNHMLAVPDPNVMIAHNAKPIPIEMVVRGYITGVTPTSPWGSYEKGERIIYGIVFPESLRKNQKLPESIITPTTHPEAGSAIHDERLTKNEILEKKLVPEKLYQEMEKAALSLFDFGTKLCQKHGIILVDTKYEFGLFNGNLILIDEVHTPDSSRFWIQKTYQDRFKKGLEPDNFDKEFLRIWYKNKGYTGDGTPPPMPKSLVEQVSKRYIDVYETITGEKFVVDQSIDIEKRIQKNVDNYFKSIYE